MTLIAQADCELLLETTPVVSPTASNTCAIIVTCCPDNPLEARLAAIFGQVREIAVIDNNSDGATVALLQKLSLQQRIHLIQNHENRGVATALNQGLAWALERAHTWALLLDQDTVVAPNIVASLAAVYQAFADGGRLAVIGSNYIGSVK